MSKTLEQLPADYRFTDEDNARNWEILGKYFIDPDFNMTPAESDFTDVMEIAERLKQRFNFWPTKESVIEEIERSNAYWIKTDGLRK